MNDTRYPDNSTPDEAEQAWKDVDSGTLGKSMVVWPGSATASFSHSVA